MRTRLSRSSERAGGAGERPPDGDGGGRSQPDHQPEQRLVGHGLRRAADNDDDEGDRTRERPKKGNKHKPSHQPSVGFQRQQFYGAVAVIQQQIGRILTKDELDTIHRLISKMGYDYWQIVQEGVEMYGQ